MEDQEIIPDEQGEDEHKAEDIPLNEGNQAVDGHGDEQNQMGKRENCAGLICFRHAAPKRW